MARIDWTEAIKLETEVSILIKEQEEYGIYFNEGKARYYISLLEELKKEQYSIVRPYLTYEIVVKESKSNGIYNYVKKIKLKNGEYTDSVLKHFKDPSIVSGKFSRIEIEEPSISKRTKIIDQLLRHGWKPTLFTDKGQPKLTEKGEPVESLQEVGDFGKALALWYTYNHRQSQINGFFEYVRKDSRISAQCRPCATNTFRARHKVVANIPRPTSIFGKEMRSLFGVAEGRKFVGADVSGLELRMLAHHMNNSEYISQILKGDIHLYHLSKTGNYIFNGEVDLDNLKVEKKRLSEYRDIMKTFIYGGVLYGGGDAKAGKIIGGSTKDGKDLKETFFNEIPSLKDIIDKVQRFAKKYGWLPSIDNRKIFIRKFEGRLLMHTALNALLQANGSIVTKRAMIIAAKRIKKLGLDAHQILFYHDEFAYDSAPECAEEVGKILTDSMRLAGEYYNLNIPISGEYAIGMDWGVH